MRLELTRECSRTSHSLRLSVYLFPPRPHYGVIDENRTRTGMLPQPPQGGASTCSATITWWWILQGSNLRQIGYGPMTLTSWAKDPIWWRQRGSNPWPHRCERCALPTELCPHLIQKWWSRRESNPHGISHQFLKLACLPFHHLTEKKLVFSIFGNNFQNF